MGRGWAELGALPELLPVWTAVLLAVLTQLGDPWFVAVLVLGLFLVRPADRKRTAVVGGLVVAGMGLTIGLKHAFAFPRPVRPPVELAQLPGAVRTLFELTASADGYGFPSGHAVLSTTTYGGLAAVLSLGSRRRRFLVAGGLVTLVGFTRVALGVHYLVDVVAGVALGGLLVGVGWLLVAREGEQSGTIALGLGLACSFLAVGLSGAALDSLLLLGTAAVALGGWWQYDRREGAAERDAGGSLRSQ